MGCRLPWVLLVDDPAGAVRDPQVHYDGQRVLFSYRPGGTPYFHLHEINADGTGLRQLTRDPYDDLDPSYLPDGGIVFCSSRCHRFVPCWYVQVATLHRCDADGSSIRGTFTSTPKPSREVMSRRCASCHTGPRRLPESPADGRSHRTPSI